MHEDLNTCLDARIWAEEFINSKRARDPRVLENAATVATWFASAILAGENHALGIRAESSGVVRTPSVDSHLTMLRTPGGESGWLEDPEPFVQAEHAREIERDRDACLRAIRVHVADKARLVKTETAARALLSATLPMLEDLAGRMGPRTDSASYCDKVRRAKTAVERFLNGDKEAFPLL